MFICLNIGKLRSDYQQAYNPKCGAFLLNVARILTCMICFLHSSHGCLMVIFIKFCHIAENITKVWTVCSFKGEMFKWFRINYLRTNLNTAWESISCSYYTNEWSWQALDLRNHKYMRPLRWLAQVTVKINAIKFDNQWFRAKSVLAYCNHGEGGFIGHFRI